MGFEVRDISQALKALPRPIERGIDQLKHLTSALERTAKAMEEANKLERNRQSIEYVVPASRPMAMPVQLFPAEDKSE